VSEFEPGLRVDRWCIERELGAGAFGSVWGASDVETGEWVAIKRLLPAAANNPDHVARFRREAANLKRVNSDYVAHLVGFLEHPELGMLLVMEFIEGELLSTILRETSLSTFETVEMGIHLARGLIDLHHAGIVHRDIKPSNIMVRPLENGLQRGVIFDLGLSRANAAGGAQENSSVDLTATASRVALGTPGYMAPEQLLDARKATAAADIYALGVVLHKTASGRLPFEGDERKIAQSKLTADPPPLDLGRSDEVSVQFASIVDRCIRRRPADRYQTAQELLNQLLLLRDSALAVVAGPKSGRPGPMHSAMDDGQLPATTLADVSMMRKAADASPGGAAALDDGAETKPSWGTYALVAVLGAALMLVVLWIFGKI
jgi:eukaryotic-like serine/threonine-protein kinase